MEVTIKKTYKGNGFREPLTVEEAKHLLEEKGYYKEGTIDKLIEEKKDFQLQSDFAVYEFQIKCNNMHVDDGENIKYVRENEVRRYFQCLECGEYFDYPRSTFLENSNDQEDN